MDIPDDLTRELCEFVDGLEQHEPVERVRTANALHSDLQDVITELSRIRREGLEKLAETMNHPEIAATVGNITRQRVQQILSAGSTATHPPERALLGAGRLTVAIAGRPDQATRPTAPAAVISEETSAAYDLLAAAAADLGLGIGKEVVRPPGIVNLARRNLIVLGSPRLLPIVLQVLGADRHLGFGHTAQGWHLVEHNTIHRSPSDDGRTPIDYAYLGKLPRPDSKGSFIYAAGIHAPGTLGAVHHLVRHVSELYQQHGTGRWSVLIETHYDPDTRQVLTTEPLTPIYT